MRPIDDRQSAARFPLNLLLGTEGAVRVLRLLTSASAPLSTSAIAERASLDVNGTRRTLTRLQATGVVTANGQHALLYALNARHRLAPALSALFEAERQQYEHVLQRIRQTVIRLHPRPDAAWLFGSVARGEDRMDGDVDIALLGRTVAVRHQARDLEEEIRHLMQDESIRVSVLPITQTEWRHYAREKRPLWHNITQDGVVIYGQSPQQAGRS